MSSSFWIKSWRSLSGLFFLCLLIWSTLKSPPIIAVDSAFSSRVMDSRESIVWCSARLVGLSSQGMYTFARMTLRRSESLSSFTISNLGEGHEMVVAL